MKNLIKKPIFLILIVAFGLRLLVLDQSLWLDEGISALAAQENTFSSLVNEFPKVDNHPPLYYLTLKAWGEVFGYSDITLRLLSVFFGLLTIYFLYLVSKEFLDKKYLTWPALLLATSPFHIYFSQEIRMYSMVAFLGTACFYFFIKVLKKGKGSHWLYFTFFYTTLIFTDYVPVFLYPVFPIIALAKKKKKDWWQKYFLVQIPLVVLGIIWLPNLFAQSERGSWLLSILPSWQNVAGGASLKELILLWSKFVLGRISFSPKVFYFGLVGLFSLPFLFSFWIALSKSKKIREVWIWFLVPLILGFVTSFIFPLFIYFRFLFLIPTFYLLVSFGLKDKKLFYLLVFINIVGLSIYAFDTNQHREDWKGAVSFVEKERGEEAIVLFEGPFSYAPYTWYTKGVTPSYGATDEISADKGKTSELTKRLTKDKKKVYYFEYLADLVDPARFVRMTLESEGFEKREVYNFRGVGQVYYYTR